MLGNDQETGPYTGIGEVDDVTMQHGASGWAYEWRSKERPTYVESAD
jgi:hypothetical protein